VCALVEAPAAADTAHVAFTASGLTREVCALRLISLTFRPWTAPSHVYWTVQVVVDDAGATARPLGREEARNLLDTGVALVATEDLALVTYVAARPEFEVVPLPWDRMYIQVSPGGIVALGAAAFSDAVRVDARPTELPSCDTIFTSNVPPTNRRSRVVYQAGDRTARDLAERVVALSGGSEAVALARADFETALRNGSDLAYILSVPRSSDDACEVQVALRARAEWIARGSFVPLIDTRAYAIIPRDSAP
jgi:hypothetical protein